MKFQLDIFIPDLEPRILHSSKILLIGSCFTEHMTNFLNRAGVRTMQNPHGIIFNPLSVCKALQDVVENKPYTENDLFFLNEYWHSWFHHSDFSDMEKEKALEKINTTIRMHHQFLQEADHIFITLGSSFAYKLLEKDMFVSNNHRAPAQWFEKTLLDIDLMRISLEEVMTSIRTINPSVRFVFTVSPVRHSRDGVIENNRSKARLLEVIHSLKDIYYFPSYELVIDILRDYRFYDLDMVHPNYQATAFVWEKFVTHCMDPQCIPLMKQLDQIYKAKNHISRNTESEAHKKFRSEHYELCRQLKEAYPYLDLDEEMTIFRSSH